MLFNDFVTFFMGMLMSLFIIPADMLAQTAVSHSDASARAVVLWSVDVTGIQNLQFDEIVMGEQKEIDLDGTVRGLNSSGREQAGKFRITTPQSFSIQFKDLPSAMEGPGGISMPIEFFAAWSDEQFPGNQQLNIFDINDTLVIPSEGYMREIYLFLGARVSPAQSQLLGDYNVQVTLSIIHGI